MAMINDAVLLALIATSGFIDARERKIPNKITFTGILIGLILNTVVGGWLGLLQSIIGMFAGFAIFFIPFVMGGMGAGDVKLLGAIGALMGWKFSLMTALYSTLIGGIMVFIYLLYTGNLRDNLKKIVFTLIRVLFLFVNQIIYNEKMYQAQEHLQKNGQSYKKIYIPYGVAIAGGTILVLIASRQGFYIF